MLNERRDGLKRVVEAAEGILQSYAKEAASGSISQEEAKRRALDRLSAMRYDHGNYIFVIDSRPVVLMHPWSKDVVGKNVGDRKDSDGVRYYSEMVARAKAEKTGFVNYMGRLPGEGETNRTPKVTYVIYYAPWDWVLASGVFLNDVQADFYRNLLKLAGMLALIGLVVSAMMLTIIRNITNSLGGEPDHAVKLASRIARGDLKMKLEVESRRDSSLIGELRRMQLQLTDTLRGIRTATDTINLGASEIAAGNLDLSSRTEQQAASLEETASSLEQLTAAVQKNAENAKEASRLAISTSEIAQQGGVAVGKVVETMSGISESSRKISEITTVIDGIAFQTNILALNAAVEAARAGEHGRGFAVVAGEVRNLAQRSASAAKEINGLISDSVSRVTSGAVLVKRAGGAMDEILVSVQQLQSLIGEIAAATEEQDSGIGEVNLAVSQMDKVTQQNAALVEEAAAAAASLDEQAKKLKVAVEYFEIQ